MVSRIYFIEKDKSIRIRTLVESLASLKWAPRELPAFQMLEVERRPPHGFTGFATRNQSRPTKVFVVRIRDPVTYHRLPLPISQTRHRPLHTFHALLARRSVGCFIILLFFFSSFCMIATTIPPKHFRDLWC